MKNFGSYAVARVRALAAYTPGEQPSDGGWVKLNTNENPYPPSPLVAQAIAREVGADGASLRLYPNPLSARLREAIARHHGVSPDWVIAGNGSDDILNLFIRAFTDETHPFGMTVPSYSLYSVLARAQGADVLEVPFDRSMALPVDAVRALKANLFILTTPNAPTGAGFAPETIARAAEGFGGVFVADEAYAPFDDTDTAALLPRLPNFAIVRTFSKAYGLAGMRIGYALAHPDVVAMLDRVRDSYNLDRLAQVAAVAALEDAAYFDTVRARVRAERERFEASVRARGWFAYPSRTNFVFVEPRDAAGNASAAVAGALFAFLKKHKILVRAFPNHPLTSAFLRITVGTSAQMAALNQALDLWHTNA